MGSCVSVHRNPDSAMKIRLSFGSKTKKLLIPSPTKEKPVNGENPIDGLGFKSTLQVTSRREFGSKEETFFDSQPWLDSDCEDDFFSVNGDFTPSRGNTPVHPSSFLVTPRQNKSLFTDRAPYQKPESSPIDKKKKLADLFKESFGKDQVHDEQNITVNHDNGKQEPISTIPPLPPKSGNGTPYLSGANSLCSSDRTPNGDVKVDKEKPMKATQCCLPRLVTSLSFNERKKRLSNASNGEDQFRKDR